MVRCFKTFSLKNDDSCTLTIKDNGRGFDIKNAEPKLGQKLPYATTDLKIDKGVIFTLNFSL